MMFDIHWGDAEITTLILVFSVVILLPLQLFICFKAKKLAVKLLPVLFFSLLTLSLIAVSFVVTGWDGLGYLILAFFAGYMLLICGIGWGIWAAAKLIKKKKADC